MRLLAGALLFVVLPASLFAQKATTRFEPSTIYLDQTTTYELVFENIRRLGNMQLPQVDGLIYQGSSQSTSVESINGQMSAKLTISVRVKPARVGNFTIPEFNVGGITVPAAQLQVLAVDDVRQQQIDDAERMQKEMTRSKYGITFSIPEGPIYVGQAIPISITIYLRRDARMGNIGLPVKDADEFTLEGISQSPEEKLSPNRNYHMLIWDAILTPVKAGEFPLQFTAPASIPTGFFQSKQLELSSDVTTISVLPLPLEDKPTDFTGAIGSFSIEQPTLDTTTAKAGEPLTLRVVVDGQGNFDRMDPPLLVEDKGWRTYPPEEQFNKADKMGYKGIKIYEYVIIPRSENVTQTPELNFNFFEPNAGDYVTMVTKPIAVTVEPAPPGSRPIIEPRSSSNQQRGPTLLPLMTSLGTTVQGIRPLFLNPVFLAGQALPLALIAGLFFWRRQQIRLESDTAYTRMLRAKREVVRRLKAAEQAAGSRDAPAFFEEAVCAIQEVVAPDLEREPESLTLNEVEAYFVLCDLDDDGLKLVRHYFDAGDALRFGGLSTGDIDFQSELVQLKALLGKVGGARK